MDARLIWQTLGDALSKDVLVEMKKEIPIILVKLEKNFPPAFFDVMIHLVVHLPDGALLRVLCNMGESTQLKGGYIL
jgi:hypothetical protein